MGSREKRLRTVGKETGKKKKVLQTEWDEREANKAGKFYELG